MKRLVPILSALIALASCGSEPAPVPPPVPSVRLATVPGRPAAGYFELDVADDRGALLSVSSPQAARIEMHETMTSGNMASMRALDRIPVRPGDHLVFAPGGRHLMIYDVAPTARSGSRFPLILHFERGADVSLDAKVQSASSDR